MNDMNLVKRVIMEDYGFKSNHFQSKAGPDKQNKELQTVKARHANNLKEFLGSANPKKKGKKSLEHQVTQDLRSLPTVTIDSKGTKCRDDAISFLSSQDVKVHITDITALVPQSSLFDSDAKENAQTTYVGDFVRPMLPPQIAYDLGSLTKDQDRFAFTFHYSTDDS